MTSDEPSPQRPQSLQLSTHELLATCLELRMTMAGESFESPGACTRLNRRTGRRFTAARWLAILNPYLTPS